MKFLIEFSYGKKPTKLLGKMICSAELYLEPCQTSKIERFMKSR